MMWTVSLRTREAWQSISTIAPGPGLAQQTGRCVTVSVSLWTAPSATIAFERIIQHKPQGSLIRVPLTSTAADHRKMRSAAPARQCPSCGCFTPSNLAPRLFRVRHSHEQHASRQPQQVHWQQQHHQGSWQQSRSLQLARAEPPSSSPDGNSTPPNGSTDSDLNFLLKLLGFSFAGAALIKYGSLALSLPFEPSPAVATGIVLGTPAAYSLYLLTQSKQQQQ